MSEYFHLLRPHCKIQYPEGTAKHKVRRLNGMFFVFFCFLGFFSPAEKWFKKSGGNCVTLAGKNTQFRSSESHQAGQNLKVKGLRRSDTEEADGGKFGSFDGQNNKVSTLLTQKVSQRKVDIHLLAQPRSNFRQTRSRNSLRIISVLLLL